MARQEQRIDVPTAIMLYTKVAQEISRIPNIGKPADFIVLDQDTPEMSRDKISTVLVNKTYLGGGFGFSKIVLLKKA